jgi:hypothetical protein
MEKIINLQTYEINPKTEQDIVPILRRILEERNNNSPITINIPKGNYHLFPTQTIKKDYYMSNTTDINPKNCGIFLEKLHNITIDGNGATFMFHDRMSAFVIDQSSNIIIKNLKIDWARPLQSEAKVIESAKNRIVISLDETKYPYKIKRGKIIFTAEQSESAWWGVMEFDPNERVIPIKTGDSSLGPFWRLYKAKPLSGHLVELKGKFFNPPKVGHYLIMRHHERDHAGIFITESKYITLENVEMYANAGLGILSQYSQDLSFSNVNFIPNRTRHEIVSGHDDGLQFSNCRGDLFVKLCAFEGLMDDPINVHGTSVRILKMISKTTLRAKFMHHQSVGMPFGYPGDSIGFIEHSSMETVGNAHIKSIKHISLNEFDMEFDTPIPQQISKDDALENLTWIPNITIQGCQFLSCRARGILISTPGKVIIENNYFKSSGSAILIAGDANGWYESGAVKDVLIRNNEFSDYCLMNIYQFCEAIISIYPIIPKPNESKPFHENITIEGNRFFAFDFPILYALSTKNLKFQRNIIKKSDRFPPFHPRKAMLTFEYCQQIQISENQLDIDNSRKYIKLIRTPSAEIDLKNQDDLIF